MVIVGVLPASPAGGTTVTAPVAPEVNEPVSTPLVMPQVIGPTPTPAPMKVQAGGVLASEANPTPLTVITLPVKVTGGESVTEGSTLKVVVPLSAGQVTVIVYAPLEVYPGAFPTTKEPYTLKVNTCATAPVTTLGTGPVIWQLVPSGVPNVTPVKTRNITSPYLPEAEAGDMEKRVRVPACACLGGVATE